MRRWIDELSVNMRVALAVLVAAITIAVIVSDVIEKPTLSSCGRPRQRDFARFTTFHRGLEDLNAPAATRVIEG